MKKLLLIPFALFILTFSSCDDDPINTDDKKLISSLAEYKIVYTTIENKVPKTYICNNNGSEKTLLFDSTGMLFPCINSQTCLSYSSYDEIYETFFYDFSEQKKLNVITDEEAKKMWVRLIPNSDKILMGRSFDETDEIYIADRSGANKVLLSDEANGYFIRISPDGSKILMLIDQNWYVSDSDGTNKKLLFESYGINAYWHIDSKHIIRTKFVDDNTTNIELVNVETSGLELIKKLEGKQCLNARFSPDGKKIAFYDEYLSLYIMNSDGSNMEKIKTSTAINVDEPIYAELEWAPDSKHILYDQFFAITSGKGSAIGLELINIDTKNTTTILNTDNSYKAFWVNTK